MARSRNIKPGFFTNEDLVELDFAARLLFAGLWTLADREGRLEDRPKKIKMSIFPADDVEVDHLLDALGRTGLIKRYEAGGKRFIKIPAWAKHQNPHHTEKPSDIPDEDGSLTVKAQEPPESPPVTAVLIPDSGFLIPDSLGVPADAGKPSRAKPKTKLPADFVPDETGERKAKEAGFRVEDELPKFRDHHVAKGSTMADWQAAFRTWIDKAKQFRRAPSQTYAEHKADLARTTVPSPTAPDPELVKARERSSVAAAMPQEVRAFVAQITRKTA